jgi:hypothetical protein
MSEIQADSAGSAGGQGATEGGSFGLSLTRLAEVFYAPVAMFRGMTSRWGWSDWLVPLLVGILVSTAASFVIVPHLDMETPAREQLEARGMSGEQLEQALAGQRAFFEGPFGKVIMLSNIVVYPIWMAIMGLIFWGAASAMGGRLSFGRVYSIYAYSWMPKLVEGLLLMFVLQGREAVRQDRLGSVLATNPASYLDPSTAGSPFYAVVSALNPFTLWVMALVALGLSEIGRLSRGAAFGVVIVLFAIYVALTAGWAAIF